MYIIIIMLSEKNYLPIARAVERKHCSLQYLRGRVLYPLLYPAVLNCCAYKISHTLIIIIDIIHCVCVCVSYEFAIFWGNYNCYAGLCTVDVQESAVTKDNNNNNNDNSDDEKIIVIATTRIEKWSRIGRSM